MAKRNGDNVAMTKYDFAKNVFNATGDFKNVSFEHFSPIFELIRTILSKAENTTEENDNASNFNTPH